MGNNRSRWITHALPPPHVDLFCNISTDEQESIVPRRNSYNISLYLKPWWHFPPFHFIGSLGKQSPWYFAICSWWTTALTIYCLEPKVPLGITTVQQESIVPTGNSHNVSIYLKQCCWNMVARSPNATYESTGRPKVPPSMVRLATNEFFRHYGNQSRGCLMRR